MHVFNLVICQFVFSIVKNIYVCIQHAYIDIYTYRNTCVCFFKIDRWMFAWEKKDFSCSRCKALVLRDIFVIL